MDQTEIYIKQNIKAAREAMSEKIELIENRIHKVMVVPTLAIDEMISHMGQLKGSVEEVKGAIDHGLDTIIPAVEETIFKAQSTVNDIYQGGHNPWIMFGSIILMGYAVGSLYRKALIARCHASTQVEESYR
jgi:hypothetical protein